MKGITAIASFHLELFDFFKTFFDGNFHRYRDHRKEISVTMIKSVLIVNNHGKPRLLKFYEKLVRIFIFLVESLCSSCQSIEQQQQVVQQVFQIVSKRSDHICNFVEGENTLWGADTKIIYR